MSVTPADPEFMARALVLAERGRSTVRPNPLVGCVLVRDGEIVGEGHHERPGAPHAEVVALRAAGDRAAGATAYVTLEPCDHVGRTGPCSHALIDAGVARVVYATSDPNPPAAGGAARLGAAGIEVAAGVLADWAERQNAVFLTAVGAARPHVTLKLAQTPSGELSPPTGRWITGPSARSEVHRLRAAADAVLVGIGTVLADDPRLDVRHVAVSPAGQPRPVVVDSGGRTPEHANIVRAGALVVTRGGHDPAWAAALARRGAEVVVVPPDDAGRVALPAALRALADRGVGAVLAEPGAHLAAGLVAAGVVDRLVLHVGSGHDGDPDRVTPAPCTTPPTGAGWSWRRVAAGSVGTDLEVVALRRPHAQRSS